jgi:hypothetical protein
MTQSTALVLPQIDEPSPLTPVRVKKTDKAKRTIWFDATPAAYREIKAKSFGLTWNAQDDSSGWCAMKVNRCYDFEDVLRWMLQVQTPDEEYDETELVEE